MTGPAEAIIPPPILVMDRTADVRSLRMLTVVDELARKRRGIDVSRKLTSEDA